MSDAPKVGDFIVYRTIHGFAMAGPVIRCTDASAYVSKDYGRRNERRLSFEDVVFTGGEKPVSELLNRLQSSQAQCIQEKNSANARLGARNEKLIADAMISSRSGEG